MSIDENKLEALIQAAAEAAAQEDSAQRDWLRPSPEELLERWLAMNEPGLSDEEHDAVMRLARELIAEVDADMYRDPAARDHQAATEAVTNSEPETDNEYEPDIEPEPEPAVPRTTRARRALVATPAQAIEAYERLGSDRKAAAELLISRT